MLRLYRVLPPCSVMRFFAVTALFLVTALLATPPGVSWGWDAADDFSATSNPSGQWSYGWTASLGGTPALYVKVGTWPSCALPEVVSWYEELSSDPTPHLTHNGTPNTVICSDIHLQANELVLHPGPGGEYSVLRWTAPATGVYLIQATFGGRDDDGVSTDVHVLHNGTLLFSAAVTGTDIPVAFQSDSLALAEGDAIDFAVGYGDWGYENDTTGLDAVVLGTGYPPIDPGEPGSVVAWGNNDYGQLDVPAPNSDFVAVAGGFFHILGLKADSSVVAWGWNDYGQCNVPEPNSDFVAVAGGYSHSLGLKSDSSVVAWGDNWGGQCDVPEPNSDFVAVAGGYHHSLGLKSDSSVVVWGWNGYGQCDIPEPNSDFVAVAGGYSHSLGLKSDSSVVAWGYNSCGQCDVPAPNNGFIAMAGGDSHSLGLKADGSIMAWGDSTHGELDVPEPNSDFVAVAAGHYHSLGLKSSGTIVAWGYNDDGQCDVPATNGCFMAVAAAGDQSLGIQPTATAVPDRPPAGGPGAIAALGAFPNPLTSSATIEWRLTREEEVKVAIHDLQGRLVRGLLSGNLPAGTHRVAWDGRDEAGRPVASGIFFVRVACRGAQVARMVVLVR